MLLDLATERKRNAISLTPLIDVVFILLLFFMLSSSFIINRQIDIPLPDASDTVQANLHRVSLTGDSNSLFIQGRLISLTDHKSLAELIAAAPRDIYLISISESVMTQDLIIAMDALNSAGAQNVSVEGLEL